MVDNLAKALACLQPCKITKKYPINITIAGIKQNPCPKSHSDVTRSKTEIGFRIPEIQGHICLRGQDNCLLSEDNLTR